MTDVGHLPDAPREELPAKQRIEDAFAAVKSVIQASVKPLPAQTGDGSYLPPSAPTGLLKYFGAGAEGFLHDLQHADPNTIETLVKTAKTQITGVTDDRTYLMENIIKLAAHLTPTSKLGLTLTNSFITKLWNDLEHPPLSYLGEKFLYRQADGSYNNIRWPQLGAANTPYARSVQPQTIMPADLPDPGVLFDSVMVRKGFTEHPNQISSMLFYLAAIIIHDLFLTDHNPPYSNSCTSSYLDLSPLYGNNQDEQNGIRTFKDGKLKADCFSEKRVLGFPPGVGVMLIMFNRFHNYVVGQLALINEGQRFSKPKEGLSSEKRKIAETKYDFDLFQTGRLITCGLYVNCILKDYVRTILNLNQSGDLWDLDPRVSDDPSAAEGIGNQVSAEFNLVYRWHAALSERDDKWTQQAFKDMFAGKDANTMDFHEMIQGLEKWEKKLSKDPQQRNFANLARGPDGTLGDDELVEILADSIDDVAGSFGANRVPAVLRAVEILGINQARKWGLATLNEFRAFFKLAKHETFEDINRDKAVADQLRHLYDHPDFVELYPGLVVEEAKIPQVPGSGLCPSFTVSTAILADAVALVRGDRFYTIDYTPKNLTNWGFSEANYDVNVDQGHVFYKLILRAFPNHFKPNSVWAHYPLVIPSKNKLILEHLRTDDQYEWSRPTRIPSLTLIKSHDACKKILNNKLDYKVTWGEAIKLLMHRNGKEFGADFMLSGDGPVNASSRDVMSKAIYRDNWHQEIKKFYKKITLQLLRENSYKIAGANQVDIVRDVGNLAQAHFAAEVFCLPLKTKVNPRGIYAEQQLYTIMALVFTCIFYDADPPKSFPLRQAARTLTQQLGELVQATVEPLGVHGFIGEAVSKVMEHFHKHTPLSEYGVHMIQQLLKSGQGVKDIVWSQILPTAGGMVANQGQLFAQCLDYYLSEEGEPHLKELNRLAKMDTEEADELILRYFMEGSRITSSVGLYRDVATASTIQDGDKTLNLKPGQRIMVDCVTASHDPSMFPNPETVDLTRDMDSYIHYGMGPHICLGLGASKVAMTTMLKTVVKLDNLRRTKGAQGKLKSVTVEGGFKMYMTSDQSSYWPFPSTMKVQWDGELPDEDVAVIDGKIDGAVNGASDANGTESVSKEAAFSGAKDHGHGRGATTNGTKAPRGRKRKHA